MARKLDVSKPEGSVILYKELCLISDPQTFEWRGWVTGDPIDYVMQRIITYNNEVMPNAEMLALIPLATVATINGKQNEGEETRIGAAEAFKRTGLSNNDLQCVHALLVPRNA